MLSFVRGNLFDCNAEAIVNTVNCVGVMGRGIALQFKKRYPDNFNAYEIACRRGFFCSLHFQVFHRVQKY